MSETHTINVSLWTADVEPWTAEATRLARLRSDASRFKSGWLTSSHIAGASEPCDMAEVRLESRASLAGKNRGSVEGLLCEGSRDCSG